MIKIDYNIIIDKWSTEYGIEFSTPQRNMLINLYESAIVSKKFKELEFSSFTENVFKQKYYKEKYPGLDVFAGAYSRISQN